MSHYLLWDNHYKYILSNAYKMLGLLRRTFPKVDCVQAKKALYLSLVRSKLTYCSPIWRPHFLKDIQSIENVQRRATKFITNDYSSDYKYRLICLQILPLMMQFELNDVMFFVSSIRNPTKSFNILQYVNFSGNFTRASVNYKLVHHMSRTNKVKHFYFHRLPSLWNSLPTINLDQSLRFIKFKLRQFFWSHFVKHLYIPLYLPMCKVCCSSCYV